MNSSMFLENFWYAAAWSREIGREPFARTICNEPMVFYRTQDRSVVAMEDRCCHRRLPLSMGKVVGDDLQCHYHGLLFEPGGRCVKVPGQELVPPSARVRTFAAREKYGLIWVFLGDAAKADEAAIPDYHWLTDSQWGAKGAYFNVKANYRLIVENLLDLTHLAFVHASTIGNAAVVDNANVQFKRSATSVDISRVMKNVLPPPTYVRAGGFEGNIDRFQHINFTPPCFVRLETGGIGLSPDGAPQGNKITLRNLNLITPQTASRTHYFWAQCHDFDVGNQALTDLLFNDVEAAFLQDVAVFEAQEQSIALDPDALEIDVNADAGGLQARRILRQLLDRQNQRAKDQ